MEHGIGRISRREVLKGAGASLVTLSIAARGHAQQPQAEVVDFSALKVLAEGIQGPEGPSILPDGSIAMVEFVAGNVLHVGVDGTREILASPGSGVAGTALGKDGKLYVVKITAAPPGQQGPSGDGPHSQAPSGDSAQAIRPQAAGTVIRIDLKTKSSATLYTQSDGANLRSPDDLVIDAWGDIWFTDISDQCVYWAHCDGSAIRRVIPDVDGVNGIALSPNRKRLYITGNGKLLAYTIVGRGSLEQQSGHPRAIVLTEVSRKMMQDGMKTEAGGNILVACWGEGIFCYAPDGMLLSQTKFPGLSIINMCFGGADMRTMYIAACLPGTLTGKLISIRWPRAGLKLIRPEY